MARRVKIEMTCDLHDGEEVPATQTLTFALGGGSEMELDVCDDHEREFYDVLQRFIDAARKVGRGNRTASTPRRARSNSRDNAAIREWAKNNNIDISERGRIPASVVEQYEQAQAA